MSRDIQSLIDWLSEHTDAGADLYLDSRAIDAGDIYIALAGAKAHGAAFIASAVASGAKAVLCDDLAQIAPDTYEVPVKIVPGLRGMLGELADEWYGKPSGAMTVIAVTGTNGKTSTVQWLVQALQSAGHAAGAIGTLGVTATDGSQEAGALTTPDVLSMHRTLAQLRDAGAMYVALEASSIGLAQGRLDGVRIALGALTNLSRDHLDFHENMAAYEAAKARLFAWPGLQASLLNIDDAAGRRIQQTVPNAATYAIAADDATIRARDVKATAEGQTFTLVLPAGEVQVVTRLLGEHNVYNLLLVAGVLHQLGWSFAQIEHAISGLTAIEGRLQTVVPLLPIASSRAPLVVVDYAHTPDALGRALMALQPVARARGGRLICLFGCGGDRDAGKRPEMARCAVEFADALVVTSDNPRSEDPADIIGQIVAGFPVGSPYAVHSDRPVAIMLSIWDAAPADVVLLAGKGHETYQETAGQREPMDDREWARLALLLPNVSVSTDTRKIGASELFVALTGPSFDGHDYLDQAHQSGASAALVAHRVDSTMPQIVLGPTGTALIRMATAWRLRFDIPVIAVVGSNGKTTTKEMVSAILAQWLGEDRRLATAGNLNNEIGVPLTLLRLREQHAAAVIELGMNHPGEIAILANMTAPSVAVLTNAQREHQEFMQSVEAVARENGDVFLRLPGAAAAPTAWHGFAQPQAQEPGSAVFPRDDAYASVWDDMAGAARHSTFGLTQDSDVWAHDIVADDRGTTCQVVTPKGSAMLSLAVPGQHNLNNALAAIAAALQAGVPLQVCLDGLAAFKAVAGRMQSQRLADGTVLIDDTYNANPDSVRAAVDVLSSLPSPRVLVLGDMGEVGENGPAMHHEVGDYARQKGVDVLLTLGEACKEAVRAFGSNARACESVEDVVAALAQAAPASVLVKGSRFMRMERVVKGFIGGQHAA